MENDFKAANKARREADAAKAMADYRASERAIDKNTERLRALRLAREAQQAAEPKPSKKPTRK